MLSLSSEVPLSRASSEMASMSLWRRSELFHFFLGGRVRKEWVGSLPRRDGCGEWNFLGCWGGGAGERGGGGGN